MSEIRTDGASRAPGWRGAGGVLCVVGYLSLYWVSVHLGRPAAAAVWLPAGLAAALLLLSSRRAWPLVLGLCALAHVVGALLWNADGPGVAFASLCATQVVALCCALAMRRWHATHLSLHEPRGTLLLLFPVSLAGAAAGALVFALLGALGSEPRALVDAFSGWFAAAFLGVTIVLPVTLAAADAVSERRFSLSRQAPGILLAVGFVWLIGQAFSHDPSVPPSAFDLPLAALPLLLWLLLEFDVLLLALCCGSLGLFAIAGTSAGLGPFASGAAPVVMLPVQWTVAFFGAGLMVLAAALRERTVAPRSAPTVARSRRDFIADSVQRYWYMNVDPPVPVSLPPADQIERLLDTARFGDADLHAPELYRTLGTTNDEVIGLSLRECGTKLQVDFEPMLRRFVAEGYVLRRLQWQVGAGPRAGHAIRSNCRGDVRAGALCAIWGADLDVSEQQYAETALRYSEERFYQTFKNTSDAVLIASMTDASVVNVNAGFEALSGFAHDEVVGRDPRDFLRIESPHSRRRLLVDLARRGVVRNHEIRFTDKHNRPIVCLVSAEVVDLGGTTSLVAIGHDITLQREAEAALRRSEQRFSMAFRNSPDAILLTEFDGGRILELNEGFERITGLKREQALGRSMTELGGWPDPRQREKMMQLLRQDGRVEQFEIELPLLSGGAVALSLSAERMVLEDQELVILTARDISERRRAARTLELYQQRLKSLASQLTLTEEQVRRRIAIELHDGLCQELAATIMQLTALRGTLDTAAGERLSDSIDILNQSMTSARRMVNRLSRRQLYESGFADALAALAEDTARQEDFECVFVDRRPGDEALADVAKSVRIVMYRSVDELLSNIVKYASARRVDLCLEQADGNAIVTVVDDGVGFDSVAIDAGGWSQEGFGLFSIRQQIESLGGEFTLSSVPGNGTSVTLSAPLAGNGDQQTRLSA